MQAYYINLNEDSNGFKEVHKSTCFFLNVANTKKFLGYFYNAVEAVSYARSIGYTTADGCYYCSNEAHYN